MSVYLSVQYCVLIGIVVTGCEWRGNGAFLGVSQPDSRQVIPHYTCIKLMTGIVSV